MAKQKKKTSQVRQKDDKKFAAFITTFLSIIGFVIALIAWQEDKYVMFYAKQSLVIFIMGVIAGIIQGLIGWFPIIGWIISVALSVLIFIAWLFSWINALSGEKRQIHLVSVWAEKVRL